MPPSDSASAADARWRQTHRAAGGLLLLALVLVVGAVGVGAFQRSGLTAANQVASLLAVGTVLFVARSWRSASVSRSVRRSYSTDLIAAMLLLVLATVVWAWVRAGIGR